MRGNSLVVQWLGLHASTAGGPGSIPGWGTKILQAAQHGQKKNPKKLQWDITSHQSEWPSSKSLQTINAGEGVEKREPSYAVGRNVNWYSYCGEQYGGSLRN